MQTANDIRAAFLGYFARHDHEVVASSPLVPRNDPTLLFTNAGMVQFKNVFTGAEKRPYVRATTSQKCVRAGGKHNDLENVGYTARHHTFFEMLGNFSFGDYFKERAIELAWDFVRNTAGLAKERLWVTVHPSDDVARALWKKIAQLPDARIVGHPDNLWAMGPIGPCGYCSEIFYDQGEAVAGGPPGSPDEDGDRFLEFWNLVFMQFEQVDEKTRIDLPRPSIDTGMGLERITAILQGVTSNYDIDLFKALIAASADASGVAPYGDHAVSHRVIADHLRTSAFLVADGVLPSNEGRGYVLRRIMRRAMRHAHIMGCKEPLMWRLVPALVAQMGQAFPELGRAAPLVTETLRLEETRFKQTLERGLKLLADETAKLGSGQALPGQVAFTLYDTYGFPLDLTQDVLRGQGRAVDLGGFEAAMARQREQARAAWAGSGEAATDTVWFELRERHGATEFLGYDTERAEGQLVALVVDGKPVAQAGTGAEVAFIANQTPFYGESGGQLGDAGVALAPHGKIAVEDTLKKLGDLIVHVGKVVDGTVALGEPLDLAVDGDQRTRLRANHSATHLLHEALRRRLGEHVTQKGSLVAPDRLRFDISHPKPISGPELHDVELEVNRRIRVNSDVVTRLMTPGDAVEAGALALFGEKYGEEVRVVAMGHDDVRYSVELCGGTHVRRTGDIGLFKILSESAVGAGVRRIEALTGEAALNHVGSEEALLGDTAAALRAPANELPQRVAALVEDKRRLERELIEARKAAAAGGGGGAAKSATKTVAGVPLAVRRLDGVPARELKSIADELKAQLKSAVIVLAATDESKVTLVVAVTDDLVKRANAGDLVRRGAEALGGKGGGPAHMAQGGGSDPSKIDDALAAIESALASAPAAA
jgi:alanyl-tRNA synthetase